MNFNVMGVTLFAVGAVLVYAAIKDQDPRDVVRTALGQKPINGTGVVGANVPVPKGTNITPGDRTKN